MLLHFVLQILTVISTLGLGIEVITTFTTATVTFYYANPSEFERYEAFVDAIGSSKQCSVQSTAAFIRCTITGLEEAVDFVIFAQACNAHGCGPAVNMDARTKLRG